MAGMNLAWSLVLASNAASRVRARVALETSAPIVSKQDGSELTATVTFDPAAREFVAVTAEAGRIRPIFSGPSLALACSAANEALNGLAPLPTPTGLETGAVEAAGYRRTRPAYEQDVHLSNALARLAELAGA
jgi:hypothetical protein